MLLLYINQFIFVVLKHKQETLLFSASPALFRNLAPNRHIVALMIIGILLFTGFLINRVVSNVGIFLAGVYALTQWRQWVWILSHPVMWATLMLCALPLLSDVLLEGSDFIYQRGIMKWILVLFPCFVFALPPKRSSVVIIHAIFLAAMGMSTCYALWYYIRDFHIMAALYKMSKVMPVLSLGDHIRIGWMTVVSCVIAYYELRRSVRWPVKGCLLLYLFMQIVFLHLLGAKTGLLTLYFTVFLVALFEIPRGKRGWLAIVGVLLVLLPVLAYFTIPSLKERFHFIKYDFEHTIRGEYREGLSDAVRVYSLQAGEAVVRSHPLTGVGFSRLQDTCNIWYKTQIPDLPPSNYFLPSSQLVIYWASAGLIGLAAMLLYLLLPLFIGTLRKSVWWMSFYLPASLTLLYETHLEGQLPLFAWSFFFAWFWFLAVRHADNTPQDMKANVNEFNMRKTHKPG